ncbi:hypothetical protein [Sporichthya sp.]|uniref:hypothetical protein n=1 Tax=Sporichthya sp. TaxID=65475 RepID=UPI0017CAB7F4|nr:hypothetical protein [Sporichthya sp.]MBA3743427.1 twitching motility protein PilT [Sporichthya sp.]
MSALVLDAGALLAVDRADRAMIARLRTAERHDLPLRSNAMVIAQVWRDERGRQAELARMLKAVDVHEVDQPTGRAAGVLLGQTGLTDAVDATVALLAQTGDQVLTSDVADLKRLLGALGRSAPVVRC